MQWIQLPLIKKLTFENPMRDRYKDSGSADREKKREVHLWRKDRNSSAPQIERVGC